ncbi:two component transcriptional regulator, winged helix family [Paenibacillus curdlanolyticus YK9]|uniref:Two component transcriptional regulator, winged helix family n=1 Tax=Paenibacillus curdlanolyticus YK9 TaxID=717606 RepID=E0I919_9BACL|nr:response regulator transcription factor [Paenibacillus curdlanolyticus]EFM10903.1 two component transcriptional regulator, winged helix family [Paenibacillus curdlanolyticus YK9]
MSDSIIWVEDEVKILEEGKAILQKEGFAVQGFHSFEEAKELLMEGVADIVILDWMLPDVSGLDACKWVVNTIGIPVIMVTARTDEFDKVLALEIGADDYIPKPFGMRELIARIRTVLRRSRKAPVETSSSQVLSFNELTIDTDKHEVRLRGERVSLTATEYNLLLAMASYPGRVFTRSQLIESSMGESYFGYERTLDSHIRNLRKKIEADPNNFEYILTVYAVGYKFGEPR